MLVDDMLFEQSWFSELPLRLRFLYIYLLTKCTKTGIFEVNLRKATFDMNDGEPVTRDDIFNSYGNRVQPLGNSKGIFVDYIAFNWMRDKPLDTKKNPLHRGLAQELAKFGLNFAKINEMANKKLRWVVDEQYELEDNTAPIVETDEAFDDPSPSVKTSSHWVKPTVEEVRAYCGERKNGIDAETFIAFYDSKGWMIGKNHMKSWKAAIITWEKGRSNGKVNGNGVKASDNAVSSGKSDIQHLF